MEKINILVSECLIGVNCNYKGTDNRNPTVLELMRYANLIPVCPEQLGGLTTPRKPSENIGDKVFMIDGTDVTMNYNRGAECSLTIAKLYDCHYAVLKARSPSCGYGKIYDGTFSGKLVSGNGTTAQLLCNNGVEIYSEENVGELVEKLRNDICN